MGSTLALAHPLYYNRLVQLASTSKFVHQLGVGHGGILDFLNDYGIELYEGFQGVF